MPGGRNKYTGPVNYSPEEVGDILNGSFYAALPGSLPGQIPNSGVHPTSLQSQLPLHPAGLSPTQQHQSTQQTPSPAAIAAAQAHAKNLIQKAFQMPNYYQLQSETRDQSSPTQSRVQKRRRSLASEQQVHH